jgi:hypothetical protein
MSISPVRNPIHRLIDVLASYERAFDRVHHADTVEAMGQALDRWRACHPLVWEGRTGRDDALRGLADPAKAWLAKNNSRHVEREDFDLVEASASVVASFAVSPHPMAMPELYSEMGTSRTEQWAEWNSQGERLSSLTGLISRLRELAARAGETWAPPPPAEGIVQRPFDPDAIVEESVAADAANREAFRRRQEVEEHHRFANNAFHQLPNLDALLSALDDPALRPGFVEGMVSALMRVAVALKALGVNPANLTLDVPPHENKDHLLYALGVLVAACDKGETETKRLLETAMKSPDLAYSVVRHLRGAIPEQLLSKKTPLRANSQAAKNVPTGAANQSGVSLSPLQYDILDALRLMKALDPEKRKTGSEIAAAVGGDATAQSVKAPLSDLKQRQLVDSRTGRNGGTWLTSEGLNLINSLRPK